MARVAHLDHLRQSPRTLVEQQLRDEEGAAVGVDVGFVEGGERGVGVGDVGLFVFVSLLRVWMEKCVEDRSWPGLGLGFAPYVHDDMISHFDGFHWVYGIEIISW